MATWLMAEAWNFGPNRKPSATSADQFDSVVSSMGRMGQASEVADAVLAAVGPRRVHHRRDAAIDGGFLPA
jgi:hypothetical protein